jgi:hypothetical protein
LNCDHSNKLFLLDCSQFKRNMRNISHFAEKKRPWNQALMRYACVLPFYISYSMTVSVHHEPCFKLTWVGFCVQLLPPPSQLFLARSDKCIKISTRYFPSTIVKLFNYYSIEWDANNILEDFLRTWTKRQIFFFNANFAEFCKTFPCRNVEFLSLKIPLYFPTVFNVILWLFLLFVVYSLTSKFTCYIYCSVIIWDLVC